MTQEPPKKIFFQLDYEHLFGDKMFKSRTNSSLYRLIIGQSFKKLNGFEDFWVFVVD